jgi:hypothetical protein
MGCEGMSSKIRIMDSRQSLFQRGLATLAGVVIAVAIGLGAGCGVGAAHAAEPLQIPAAIAANEPGPAAPESGRSTDRDSSSQSPTGPDPGDRFVRLPGHVLAALSRATRIDSAIAQPISKSDGVEPESMTLTLVLKRDDQEGFDRYMNEVYDPASKRYRHFLTPAQVSQRFGPARRSYSQVLAFLRGHGFTLIQGSKNRMTLTVRGSRAQVERTFLLHIDEYRIGDSTFYANDSDPALPRALAARVENIAGLSDLAKPTAAAAAIVRAYCAVVSDLLTIVQLWGAGSALGGGTAAAAGIAADALPAAAIWFFGGNFVCAKLVDYLNWAKNYPSNPGEGFLGGQLWNYPPVQYLINGTVSAGVKGRGAKVNAQTKGAAANGPPYFADGTGQTIGLLEFDTFNASDVTDFINLVTSMGGFAGLPSNLTEVPVNGGVATPGAGESEVLLDINTVMSIAPGAKVVVYDAPFSGQPTSYTSAFNAMINGGVTIISNSWASCEDQMSLAEAQGIDTILQTAAASGITVVNGTGDSGSTCLDGSANTISVPADSPSATAVGGTSLVRGPNLSYGSETWWDGANAVPPTGQGGFGISKFFSRPSYQNNVNGSGMRSIPDVVAPADPATAGIWFCQADAGGCPSGSVWGGTSMSAPTWAGFAALLNEAQGKNVGALNPLIYPFAGSGAFHSAVSMGSDFAHVGLGSPNLNVLNLSLSGGTAGTPDPNISQIAPLVPVNAAIPGTSTFGVPADGQSPGGVIVILADAKGNTVSGKTVTLTASSPNVSITPASGVSNVANGAVSFNITDLNFETVTFTATDTTDGVALPPVTLNFVAPVASGASIQANPSTLPADGQTAATIIVTLKDALNRPSPGKSVAISEGGAHAVITTGSTPAVTDANGQIQFSATDQVNETVTFAATDVTDGNLPVPGSGVVTYSGSTSTACNINNPATAGAGYAISAYVTGMPAAPTLYYNNTNLGCPGADNPAFTSVGTMLIGDSLTGAIYQTSLAGGAVSPASLLNTLSPGLGALIYGKDGSVYATLGSQGAEIVQINPTTGAIARVVASGLTCPAGLAVDPLSGDLFFDDNCSGGGTNDPSVWRVIDPANTDTANPTRVVVYATLPTSPSGGIAFAPNGTMYVVNGYTPGTASTAPVQQVSATSVATVAVTAVSGVTSDYSIAIGAVNSDGSAQSLVVEPAGVLNEVPIANPSAAVVLATGSPGAGVVGPDGCLYSGAYATIYRLAPSSGGCSFNATSPAPTINLTPASVSPNPAQGSSQSFTATLKNVATLSGVPLTFVVSGANPQIKLANTSATGAASITYTGLQTGNDSVTVTTTINGTTLVSNSVPLTWAAGKHVTFLTLNSGPHGGTINQAVNLAASLSDVSATPAVILPGQSVTLSLGGASCSATTDSTGNAACTLTPSQFGSSTLSANFAGTSTLTASSAAVPFNVSTGQSPPPTVTIAVSPTSTAAGSAATLTWSSTNATACSAGGAWSGTRAISGTLPVTPSSSGSFSYSLTCTGNGGSASATAVLSATLVAVTVTAKSGGGALSWPLLSALGLLLVLRLLFGRASFKNTGALCLLVLVMVAGSGAARADQTTTDAAATPADWMDHFDVGLRVGSMPVRLDAGKIDQGLSALGYGEVSTDTHTSGTAETVFLDYEFTPYAGLELGYTHRDANAAQLHGVIASAADLTPLLHDTTEQLRGYGNIVSLSYSGHFQVAPRFMLEPRLGGFFWATKVTAVGLDDRIDTTHEGGGVTVGLTAAYRLWRGLELGIAADHFRGFPNNIATLYSGSLEWRFGR